MPGLGSGTHRRFPVRAIRRSSTIPPLGRLGALLAAGALLAGCASAPGVAIRAGDERISEDEVASATLQYQEITGSPTSLAQVATVLARADVVSEVMADAGVVVTDDEVYQTLQESGLTPPEDGLSDASLTLWRSLLEYQEAGQLDAQTQEQLSAELSAALEETPSDANPRYVTDAQGYPLLPTWITTQSRGASAQQPEMVTPGG